MKYILLFLKDNIYVIMAAIGAIAAILMTVENFKGSGYGKKDVLKIVLLGFSALIIGLFLADLANWFFFRDNMFAAGKNYSFWELFQKAGFTFYIGLFAFCGAAALFFKLAKFDVKKLFYYIIPAIPLFHGIARVGCAIEGCCYGITINLRIGDLLIEKFPTQFCESLFLFILFFLLEFRFKKGRAVIYFTSYAVFRFLIEFLRGDDRGYLIREIPLSPSQQMAIVVVLVVIIYLCVTKLKDKKALGAVIISSVLAVTLAFSIVSAVITVLEGDRAEYDENVKTLESEKNTLDVKKASLEKSQKSLEKKLAENKTLQDKINKTINDKQKLLKKYQDEIKKLNDELEKLIQGSGGTVSENDFIWPLSKRFVITTYYLDKEYYKDFGIWHYAIDVGGSGINKSPVYASKSGTVKQSAYQAGGAGHYVIIDHGDNQLTVYYHLTSRAVNKGDKVTQGQTIGTVGSTGNSTGPHLHFGIKINGSWVDPLKYVVNRP